MKWISQQVEKREKWVGKWPGVCEKQKKNTAGWRTKGKTKAGSRSQNKDNGELVPRPRRGLISDAPD